MEVTPHVFPSARLLFADNDTAPFLRHRDLTDPKQVECAVNIISDTVDSASAPAPLSREHPDGFKPETREKMLFLDGLRGLAAMLVVCQHAGYLKGRKIGGVAVHTFFVLSAFLLTMLLEKKCMMLQHQAASRKRWIYALVDYAVRRVLRVYPLVFTVAVYLAFCSDEHRYQWYEFKFKEYNYNFLKMLVFAEGHHFYVFWTLPRELVYYMCIPVFVGTTVGLRRWWWAPLLPIAAYIVYFGLYGFVMAGASFVSHLPEFLSGSVGAVVFNRISAWVKQTNFTFTWWQRLVFRTSEGIAVLLLISVVFDALLFDEKWFGPYPFRVPNDELRTSSGPVIADHFVCVYVTILIVCESILPGPIASVLEWSLLRYAGKVSFSMYLLHPRIIFSDLMRAQNNWYTKYFAIWILSFFWSTLSYHVIEVPSQWLAGYIGKKIRVRDVAERDKTIKRFPGPEK